MSNNWGAVQTRKLFQIVMFPRCLYVDAQLFCVGGERRGKGITKSSIAEATNPTQLSWQVTVSKLNDDSVLEIVDDRLAAYYLIAGNRTSSLSSTTSLLAVDGEAACCPKSNKKS